MAKKRILVVDDEPDMLGVIKGRLEKAGYAVEVARDGAEGLEKVSRRVPDAIVLDVMMPVMDGYRMCAELKEGEAHCDIPVVMLTAVGERVGSTRYSHYGGMEMAAEDFVPKGPGCLDDVLTSLSKLLS